MSLDSGVAAAALIRLVAISQRAVLRALFVQNPPVYRFVTPLRTVRVLRPALKIFASVTMNTAACHQIVSPAGTV